VVLTPIPLVRAVFVGVPSVIVLVALVVVSLVVFDLPIFLVPVVSVFVVLWVGSGHHRNGCDKGGSQKKRTEIFISVHVVLLIASSNPENPANITLYS
jgi:hypothetical protein